MPQTDTLLPPMSELDRRLAENQRERHILRALQRLAIRAERWRAETADPRPEAGRRQGGEA